MKANRNGDCFQCEVADLQPAEISVTGTVNDKPYTVKMQGLRCPNCGFQTIEGAPAMTEFRKLVADEHRRAIGYVTGAEMVAHRAARGLTQEAFANEEPKVGLAS